MKKPDSELERQRQYWENQGKQPTEITYGMLCDGFQSLSGIPDDFYSAEDPADRVRLWNQHRPQTRNTYSEGEYKGYGDFRD